MKDYHIHQIDILKGLAICSVIVLHTLPKEELIDSFAVFHIWQAVPIFLMLLGLNTAMSFERKGHHRISEIYSKIYFSNYFKKLIYPILIIFLIAAFLGFIKSNAQFGVTSFIGYFPFTGPGNYFVTVIIQFILIFPLIFKLYKINPKIMLIVCFTVDLVFQLAAPYIGLFKVDPFYYSASIFRYLSAIALGVWISGDMTILSKRNRFIMIGLILSVIYLLGFNVSAYEFPYFLEAWGTQNLFSFFVPLILVLVGIKYLPKKSTNLTNIFSNVGKISFDIFLVQILYFAYLNHFGLGVKLSAAVPNLYVLSFINIVTCILLGKIFNFLYSKVLVFEESHK